jgi:hypothetical protein
MTSAQAKGARGRILVAWGTAQLLLARSICGCVAGDGSARIWACAAFVGSFAMHGWRSLAALPCFRCMLGGLTEMQPKRGKRSRETAGRLHRTGIQPREG